MTSLQEILATARRTRKHPLYDPQRAKSLGLDPDAIKALAEKNMSLVASDIPSPVGRVPKGSQVFFTFNGKSSVWIDGNVYTRKDKGDVWKTQS